MIPFAFATVMSDPFCHADYRSSITNKTLSKRTWMDRFFSIAFTRDEP
jgi:hypothetical protein